MAYPGAVLPSEAISKSSRSSLGISCDDPCWELRRPPKPKTGGGDQFDVIYTGQWALPGGTLEWGETLRQAIVRELAEEAGVDQVKLGNLLGVYSDPMRDLRFHAVTVVVGATIGLPQRAPDNPVEILEVRLFSDAELPPTLAHGMSQMLEFARKGERFWE